MKRILMILLALALALSLCACGAPAEDPAKDDGKVEYVAAPEDQSGEGETAPEQTAEPDPAPEAPVEPDDTQGPDDTVSDDVQEPDEEPVVEENTASQPPQEPAEDPTEAEPQPEPAPESQPEPQPGTQPEEPTKPADPPAEETELTSAEKKAIAVSLVDHPVSELYAAIGEPISSDYAPSCLIDGDDGILEYDGFTVYTERGADYETVYDVF